MNCEEVRSHLLGYPHELAPDLVGAVRAHLDMCAACTHADACEHTLTEVLEQRLPQHPASLALKRRLAARWQGSERIGDARVYTEVTRGFNVILWQVVDLGYALVSDVDRSELHGLVSKLLSAR